ncbi:MAG TPA: hypothetical protein VM290_11565 [Gaiellaceae bacterium]|nr:hypothetical protein [Gaiellaceae bacterium]
MTAVVLVLALYLAAGGALLWAVGLARTPRALLFHAGLAALLGWAAAGIAASYLLVAGAAATPLQVAGVLAVVAAAAVGVGRRAAPLPRPRALPETRGGRWLAAGAAALLAVYLLVHLRRALGTGANWWDAWAFWLPKAKSLYHFGGLDTGPGGFTSFANPEYPPLVPAVDALVFHLHGAADAAPLPTHEWALAAAALAAVAALLAPRVRPAVLWPCLLFLALVPNFGRLIGAMTGDLVVALAFAVGGLAAVLWRDDGDRALWAVSALLLAAAALTKGEGMFASLVLVAALAAAGGLRERWRGLAGLAAVPVLAVLPWRAWYAANGPATEAQYALGDLLDPGYLAGRVDRLATAVAALPRYFLDPQLWLLALPVALAAAVVALPLARTPARTLLVLAPLSFLGLAGVYWISRPPVDWHLATSAARVPASVVFLSAALLPLLLDAPLRARRAPP